MGRFVAFAMPAVKLLVNGRPTENDEGKADGNREVGHRHQRERAKEYEPEAVDHEFAQGIQRRLLCCHASLE